MIWLVDFPGECRSPLVFLNRDLCGSYIKKLCHGRFNEKDIPIQPTAPDDTWMFPYDGGTIELSCLAVTTEIP